MRGVPAKGELLQLVAWGAISPLFIYWSAPTWVIWIAGANFGLALGAYAAELQLVRLRLEADLKLRDTMDRLEEEMKRRLDG